MISRDAKDESAFVIHPVLPEDDRRRADYKLEEAVGLTEALGVTVLGAENYYPKTVRSGLFLGSGKIEELAEVVKENDIHLLVIDAWLSPVQQRNLERALKVKVIDRTGLILEIFGLRAQTKEGVLQVELARLAYERSRLVRTWTHLERQRGGQGFLAGPGETQIESDRRVLRQKITKLRRQLDQVRRTRKLHRDRRSSKEIPVVALVGYTNAGKSTLFNTLTGDNIFAEDMLFATLDTTHRKVEMKEMPDFILSDTVGFISDLPTDLIAAFRATLEEVNEADVLLHVRDIVDPESDAHFADVMNILDDLKAGPKHGQTTIEVWNKADLLNADDFAHYEMRAIARQDAADEVSAVLMSAEKGLGVDNLYEQIEAALTKGFQTLTVNVPVHKPAARGWIYEHGDVLNETAHDNGDMTVTVRLPEAAYGQFKQKYPKLV